MNPDPPLNILVVEYENELINLPLTSGGYYIDDNKITISITAEAPAETAEDIYPSMGLICLESYPIESEPAPGDIYEHQGGRFVNDPDQTPRAHGLIVTHIHEIIVKWEVVSVGEDTWRFRLEADHDDPLDYYEEPKSNPAVGIFDLPRKPIEELWIPETY